MTPNPTLGCPSGPGTLAFVTDLRGLAFDDGEAARGSPVRIEVCRDGRWTHPEYGTVEVTPELRRRFVENFQANVRKVGELPLDYDHHPGPASGWIAGLQSEESSLYADVRLTDSARHKVRSGEYRFFSPEWHPDWTDPETGRRHGPTLFGGALTNRPFFRGMAAVCCAEPAGIFPAETPTDPPKGEPESMSPTLEAAAPLAAAAIEERLAAVESENRTLRAAEERRGLEAALAGLTFAEGRTRLAPPSRTALTAALAELPPAQRDPVLAALRGLTFMELGERGFPAAPASGDLTPTEERSLRDLAARNGLRFDALREQFTQVKARRSGQ